MTQRLKAHNKTPSALFKVILPIVIGSLLAACSPSSGLPAPIGHSPGLTATTCWFEQSDPMPPHHCYNMTVNETPESPDGRFTTFPVIVFPGANPNQTFSPLLHLGGGGPGASLALDSQYNVKSIYDQMRSLSVDQGRDLYLIDPRGAGQSRPQMMCQEFVDNVISRWQRVMTIGESYDDGHKNFTQCLISLKAQGVNFSAYSSTTVVNDLETLRRVSGVEQWVLYGASYASVYAQLYARDHPERIEAMILDSATFLDTPRHEVLVREYVEPYKRLFDSCSQGPYCDDSSDELQQRFWALVQQLDDKPLWMTVEHPFELTRIPIALTGWRLLDSVLWGVYEEDMFTDFPIILDELEREQTQMTRLYVEELLAYLLDDTFGDISASSHYCVDQKPYIDDEKIREQVRKIPYPYVRNIALLGLDYTDYCSEMSIALEPGDLNHSVRTGVATLFIHGELDSVTLLDHVTERQKNFSNSHIVTSAQAHIVLDDPCILDTVKTFMAEGADGSLRARCAEQQADQ